MNEYTLISEYLDDVRLKNGRIRVDHNGHHVTNREPDAIPTIDEVNDHPKINIYPDYGSPPKIIEREPELNNNDGLLLPVLNNNTQDIPLDDNKMENESMQPNVGTVNAQPTNKPNTLIGNKRRFEDINDEYTPPANKRRRFILKIQKYLNKLF